MKGRPRLSSPPTIIQVKIRLYPGQDDDLIAFFASIPARLRATMVKQALRSGASVEEAPDEDLFDALDSYVLD